MQKLPFGGFSFSFLIALRNESDMFRIVRMLFGKTVLMDGRHF